MTVAATAHERQDLLPQHYEDGGETSPFSPYHEEFMAISNLEAQYNNNNNNNNNNNSSNKPPPPPPMGLLRRVSSIHFGDDDWMEQDTLCATIASMIYSLDTKSIVKAIKYSYSLLLLFVCVAVIVCGIRAVQTPVAQWSPHWSIALVAAILQILWLGKLEGGQGCLVGLQPVDPSSFVTTHTMTHQCTAMVRDGDNLKRFIVGRQFFVVLVVFGLSLCCSVVEHAVIPGWSPVLVETLLESGMAILIVTVIVGQLAAEVCATESMLDFLNTPVMVLTTWLCLAIEVSGLLHSVYLVQSVVDLYSSNSSQQTKPNTTVRQRLFYWARVLLSLLLLGYACVLTLSALLHHQTTMYEGPSNVANVVIFVFLVCFLGMMEAMQIALFAVVNLPKSDLDTHPSAKANCDFAFRGNNFQAFLIGRQICVTMSMFLLARVTTTNVLGPLDPTVLGISHPMQNFFNTGLPGAFITTIVASLAWRIFAACFPIPFMGSPLVYPTIRLCLLLESSGVFSAAWLFAKGLRTVLGLRSDEEYLGGPLSELQKKSNDADDITATESNETLTPTSSFHSQYGSTER